jgi:hypothetical protein
VTARIKERARGEMQKEAQFVEDVRRKLMLLYYYLHGQPRVQPGDTEFMRDVHACVALFHEVVALGNKLEWVGRELRQEAAEAHIDGAVRALVAKYASASSRGACDKSAHEVFGQLARMVGGWTRAKDMLAYKHLARDEEIRVQTSACAMSLALDGLVGHVWATGGEETEYGKGFTEARATACQIQDEVTADWRSRFVYAPERYATARKKVDDGMAQLAKLAGFEGLEEMKACGKECQGKMDAYAEVWRKIREFDASHWNAYTQRRVRGIHAFSEEKKTSMEEMLRELHVLSVV